MDHMQQTKILVSTHLKAAGSPILRGRYTFSFQTPIMVPITAGSVCKLLCGSQNNWKENDYFELL